MKGAREILDELINQVIAETVGHFEDKYFEDKYGVCEQLQRREQLQRQALTDLSNLILTKKVDTGNPARDGEHNGVVDEVVGLFKLKGEK